MKNINLPTIIVDFDDELIQSQTEEIFVRFFHLRDYVYAGLAMKAQVSNLVGEMIAFDVRNFDIQEEIYNLSQPFQAQFTGLSRSGSRLKNETSLRRSVMEDFRRVKSLIGPGLPYCKTFGNKQPQCHRSLHELVLGIFLPIHAHFLRKFGGSLWIASITMALVDHFVFSYVTFYHVSLIDSRVCLLWMQIIFLLSDIYFLLKSAESESAQVIGSRSHGPRASPIKRKHRRHIGQEKKKKIRFPRKASKSSVYLL